MEAAIQSSASHQAASGFQLMKITSTIGVTFALSAVAGSFLLLRDSNARPDVREQTIVHGEQLDPSAIGPQVVEGWDVVLEREARRKQDDFRRVMIEPTNPWEDQIEAEKARAEKEGREGRDGDGGFKAFAATGPTTGTNFVGPREGDVGANFVPPDTVGAVGLNHFVASVNANLSVYVKSTGQRVLNVALTSFFGTSGIGDPRVTFDPSSQRFIVICSNFSNRVYFAFSSSSDPTGTWFKTNVLVSQGSDAGKWPDYPTLGVDANGVYFASFMVSTSMSIFAVDKAPLVAPVQSMGTVTAFRGLPFEGAIQPCVTNGTPGGEYFVSRPGSTTLRLREVLPPMTAPTLSNLGTVSVPSNSAPPSAPSKSGSTLDTLDARLMNSVYRNGSVWTTHAINVSGRSAARWYQIDPIAKVTQQVGTISDSSLYYFMPSVSVNSLGHAVMGFTGSNSTTFASCYVTGRLVSDTAGQTAPPTLLKAGEAGYSDGGSPSRWGDYSLTSVDPTDDATFWTMQEYAKTGGIWGTWIAQENMPGGCAPPIVYCTSKLNSQFCSPAIASSGSPSASNPTPFDITASQMLNNKNGLLFYGMAPNGAPFEGGFLCVHLPVVRTSVQNSGGSVSGTDCTGTYSYDFNALIQSGSDANLISGATVYTQYWARDPADFSGFTTSLSDALTFTICP